MAIRFLSLAFVDPPNLGAELARVLTEGPAPVFTVVLRDDGAGGRMGFRVAGPDRSPGAVTAAQALSAFCQPRGLPVVLDFAAQGPDAPSGGAPVVQLLPGSSPETAERLGAAVREYLVRSPEPVGVLAVLRPTAMAPLAAALKDPVGYPLPLGRSPAWACALHLVTGIVPSASRNVTVWRT